ncbi:MAG: hypothetical protein H6625_04065 [Bdellovibrionaceae bacterium]|nr:hypothetical protein [Pseudobdellovibrionaceae bacterium]
MNNFTNMAKLLSVSIFGLSILACDGQVEFNEIPQVKNLCSDNSCIDNPIDEDTKDEFLIKTSSSSVLQEGTGGDVDILIVVDNSYSMYVEQKKMGERFGDFIKTLSDVNWRLAFTTTDASNYNGDRFGGNLLNLVGADGKIITKDTPNLIQVFRDTIDRQKDVQDCGVSGKAPCASGTEEPLKVITQAIGKSSTENSMFFRSNAALAVIVLSDEDEMSFGPQDATKPDAVINSVVSTFGTTKKFLVSGIIIQPNDSACLAEQQPDGVVATHVSSLVSLTNGITRSICDTDYKPSMQAISNNVRKILKLKEITLDFAPVKDSLKLTFYPPENAVKWKVYGQRVDFTELPKDGTLINYTYKYKVKRDRKRGH